MSPEHSLRVVDKLFERMAEFYGAPWLDRWTGLDLDKVKRTWADELADVTPQAMKHALDHLDGGFPPSLPEFRSLCKQFRPRDNGVGNVTLLRGPRQPVPEGTFKRLQNIIHAPKREEGGQ